MVRSATSGPVTKTELASRIDGTAKPSITPLPIAVAGKASSSKGRRFLAGSLTDSPAPGSFGVLIVVIWLIPP